MDAHRLCCSTFGRFLSLNFRLSPCIWVLTIGVLNLTVPCSIVAIAFPELPAVIHIGIYMVSLESVNTSQWSNITSILILIATSHPNSHVRLSLFGALTITAPNLPYALVIFSWALNSSWHGVIGDLLGIAVGHVIYFFHFVWKEELASGKRYA